MQDIFESNSSAKPVMAALWLLAVLSIVYAIYVQDSFFARTIPVVAQIESPKGDVVFRNENKIRWNSASIGSQLIDGDRVSTGRSSSAMVSFGDGRKLIMGEDSQVVISTITHSDSGMTFLVNLVKGSVIADSKKKCEKCRAIVLRSGGESFSIGKGKKEGFFRDIVADKVEKFSVTGPIPVRPSPVPVEQSTAVVENKQIVETDKLTVVSPAGYEFNVKPPAEGLSIWTHKSIASLFGASLSLPVIAPLRTPPFGKYVPIVEMSNLEGTKREILTGNSSSNKVISLPLIKLRMVATQRWSGVKQYGVTLRGGIRVLDGPKSVDSFQSSRITLTISSLGEPLGTPLALGFDRLSFQKPEGNWIAPKLIVPVNANGIQVILFGAGDFEKIIPFAVGATRYGALTSTPATTSVANIVRDGYIVAQVTKYSSIEDVKQIMKAIGGTFAFIGPKGLFQYSAGTSQDNVVKLIEDILDKGRILYFFKNDKLYPVNRAFIKDSKEVANFLGKQANLFFTEKVDIVNR